MYERMLNKQVVPAVAEMTAYCTENAERFSTINDWLTTTFSTESSLSLWQPIWLGYWAL